MKTTILGGVLFLVPIAVIAVILGKVFQISMMIVEPLDRIIPIDSFAGVAFVNVLAIVLILLVCFLGGLLARYGWLAERIGKVDGLLIDLMPGYAVAKGVIGSVAKEDDITALLKAVVVRFDDYDQIAFEIERDATKAVIFLPGSPSTWTGATIVVDLDRVTEMNMPTHKTMKLMRLLGRGSLSAIDQTSGAPAKK
jgi:uncharacterized membrane protein